MPQIVTPWEEFENGVKVRSGNRTTEITQEEVNRRELLDKAQTALTANAAFLANANPTNAQVLAQVRLLTREVNAIIRLMVEALSDVSDT